MESASAMEQNAANLLIDEIINQLDKNRGEMTRLEFTSLLIRNRLEKYRKNHNYIDEEEIYHFIKEVIELLSHYLEFLCRIKLSNIAAMPHYRYV